MKYCSKDVRQIVDKLQTYVAGVWEDSYYDIELSALAFHTNHIVGVIGQTVMKNPTPEKLFKVEVQRWNYFVPPIVSILGTRTTSHRADDPQHESTEWGRQVYNIVTSNLVLADFGRDDALTLFTRIPGLARDIGELSYAIRACHDRSVRSIPYLRGVLERRQAESEGKKREALSMDVAGWKPPEGYEQLDRLEQKVVEAHWLDTQFAIQLNKKLLDEKAKRSRTR